MQEMKVGPKLDCAIPREMVPISRSARLGGNTDGGRATKGELSKVKKSERVVIKTAGS
jgi:hypothetical protein